MSERITASEILLRRFLSSAKAPDEAWEWLKEIKKQAFNDGYDVGRDAEPLAALKPPMEN